MVPRRGLEPPRGYAPLAPEASASTNSATSAGKGRTITSFFAGSALYSKTVDTVN